MKQLLVATLFCGCGLFGGGTSSTSGGTTGSSSFGTPTLELTVNGVHAGPAAPDANSYVDLVNEYDANGTLTRSTLQIFASAPAADASCSVAAYRFGQFVTSFGVGSYTLSAEGVNSTDGATAAPEGAPSAATAQGVFSCTGSDCDGAGVSLSWIDSTHAEGFFTGTLSGADILCSFYLPTRTFQP